MISVNNSNNNSPTLLNQNNKLGVTFGGSCMKPNKIGYAHGSVVNIYIVYELKKEQSIVPILQFKMGIKITKDVNTSNYKHFGYGICFDGKSDFSIGYITNGKNVIILGCDMSFSSHANNRANNIYVLGKDFIKEINGTTIYA